MGHKNGEKWVAAVDFQPMFPKSDSLLDHDRRAPWAATMNNKFYTLPPAAAGQELLRQNAEARLVAHTDYLTASTDTLSPEATQQILHDLQVHQIELEMQNDEMRKVQLELEASRARYFDLYDLAPTGYMTVSTSGSILEANLAVSTLLGVVRNVLVFKRLYSFVVKQDLDAYYLQRKRLLESGAPQSCDVRMTKSDGSLIWVNLQATVVQQADGMTVLRMMLNDITERKQSEAKLQLAASVFNHAHEGIIITDAQGVIMEANQAFTRITGYSHDEILGKTPRILSSGRQDPTFYVGLWDALIRNGYWSGEIWNRRKNGDVYAELLAISAVHDAKGAVQRYVALFSDITEIKAHEEQLDHLAHYDSLTGLPNRRLMTDRLHQATVHTRRSGQRLVLIYIDLDGFKEVNDQYGHAVGDQLLITVARQMQRVLREGDTLARLGGDEFVAVLVNLQDTASCLPLLERLLAAASQPLPLGNQRLQVSASLGVTFYPQNQDVEGDQLLHQADQAMYRAKQSGKNCYQVFNVEEDRSLRDWHADLQRIGQARLANEFVLYYQPKVNLRTGEMVGVEALVRWQHPEKGLLAPAAFLPMIEHHALAIDVGEWVIDTALHQMDLWQLQGLDIGISLNVGDRHLKTPNFVNRLRELLSRHPNVKPAGLALEIQESSALQDMAYLSQVIDCCQEMGVAFALDDFGTGYSSLSYLNRLRVALLKIDYSLVRDMQDDPDDLAILKSVIGLASTFHRMVIAEGVETIEQGTQLLQLGCELAQGYGIARPMPAHEVPAWATSWKNDAAWSAVRQA